MLKPRSKSKFLLLEMLFLLLVWTGPIYAQTASLASLYTSRVTLTASQIQNLDTQPVVLVAAPGRGRLVVVHSVTMSYLRQTTDFTGGGVDVTANLQWSSNSDLQGDIAVVPNFQFFLQTGAQSRVLLPAGFGGAGGAGPEFTSQITNQPVTLSANRSLFSGDGRVRIVTTYEVITP